jgi:hypothetical protein
MRSCALKKMVTLVPLSREWFGKNNSRQLHTRHHSRKRMIQYTRTSVMNRKTAVYWMPAFAGHDGQRIDQQTPLLKLITSPQSSRVSTQPTLDDCH